MAESITERLQRDRWVVVEVLKEAGRLRVKGPTGSCRDVACGGEAIVEANDGPGGNLDALNPGDIIRLESERGDAPRIVVVRRVWDELTSPEF
jgi:hypothetical protein